MYAAKEPSAHFKRKGTLDNEREIKLLSAIQACKTRAILTAEQAIKIFEIKLSNQTATKIQSSTNVARAFGVSEKTVRDIWKGRTWLREIMHLDPARAAMATQLRPPGRPRQKFQPSGEGATRSNSGCGQPSRNNPAARRVLSLTETPASITSAPTHSGFMFMDILKLGIAQATEADTVDSYHHSLALSTDCKVHGLDFGGDFVQAFGNTTLLLSVMEAPPLPASSRADDPFHDDWRYWPKKEDKEYKWT